MIQIEPHLNVYRLFLDIVVLDWGELADGSYLLDAVPNAVKVIAYIVLTSRSTNSCDFALSSETFSLTLSLTSSTTA